MRLAPVLDVRNLEGLEMVPGPFVAADLLKHRQPPEPGDGVVFPVMLDEVHDALDRRKAGVVEDDEAVLRAVSWLVRSLGFHVIEAQGPRVARSAAAALPNIDILLTDVQMPDANGFEIAEELAAAHPGLRIVYMTGCAEIALAARSGSEPPPRLLIKPFSASHALEVLRFEEPTLDESK